MLHEKRVSALSVLHPDPRLSAFATAALASALAAAALAAARAAALAAAALAATLAAATLAATLAAFAPLFATITQLVLVRAGRQHRHDVSGAVKLRCHVCHVRPRLRPGCCPHAP